jgi:integrase
MMPKTAMHRGTKVTLKENGLPSGYGLFWTTRADQKYIYTKFDGQGLSCSTTDWHEAIDFVERLRGDRKKRESDIPAGNVLISELFDDHIASLQVKALKRGAYEPITARNTRKTIDKHLLKPFGYLKASKLTSQHLTDYRMKRTAECVAAGKKSEDVQYTIDHELGYLRTGLNLGVQNGKVNKASIPFFKIDKANSRRGTRHGTISDEKFEILLNNLPVHIVPMFAFCMVCPVRKKEARFIHRSEINWTQRTIRLRPEETKAGKERTVGVPRHIWAHIMAWEERTRKEHPKAEFLFHADGRQLTTEQVDDPFNDTCEAQGWHVPLVGLDGKPIYDRHKNKTFDRSVVRWHDTRRTSATAFGNIEGITDVDRRRVAGMTESTQDRYDQNNSAIKIRDGLDRKYENIQPAVVAPVDKRSKLIELKALHVEGLIDADAYTALVMEEMRRV